MKTLPPALVLDAISQSLMGAAMHFHMEMRGTIDGEPHEQEQHQLAFASCCSLLRAAMTAVQHGKLSAAELTRALEAAGFAANVEEAPIH